MDDHSAPTLLESPSLTKQSLPLKTTHLSGSYVLQLANSPLHYAAAASSPSCGIHLLDKTTLSNVHTLKGHDGGISSLRVVLTFAGSGATIVSCGKDGTVKAWDERSGNIAVQMKTPNRHSLLSMDVSPDGFTVAGGTELIGAEAFIHYWDPRQPGAPLRTHASTHSDDITALHFRPAGLAGSGGDDAGAKVLLSASTDGLLCTSNAEEDDEDEAGINVGNWGCSVSQAGWLPGSGTGLQDPKVWAASDMETFSLWTEELDVLHDFSIRKQTLSGTQTWTTDYLIGCQTTASTSPNDSGLVVFVGSNEGSLALLTPPTPTVLATAAGRAQPWTAHRLFTSSHAGVVRSVLWDEQNNVLLTGGEDSKVCLWSCPALSADAALPGARDAAASPTGSGFGGRGVLREDSVDVDGGADAAMEVGDDQQGADGAMDVDSPPRQRARKRELDPGMGRRIVEERGGKKVKRG